MAIFVKLGEVTFANTEVPESINFGGDQSLSVKQLVGGKRIVDAMGRVDDDISFSGMFFGSTATFRAKFLDTMRVSGNSILFTYSQFNYSVVIKSFKAKFERFYQIPYEIVLTVIQDLNKPLPFLLPVGYNDSVQNLLVEANDIATALANPNISTAMALLSTLINNVPSLVDANSQQIASILSSTVSAQSLVVSNIAGINSRIFS